MSRAENRVSNHKLTITTGKYYEGDLSSNIGKIAIWEVAFTKSQSDHQRIVGFGRLLGGSKLIWMGTTNQVEVGRRYNLSMMWASERASC
jgi:hypothetical protein